jgi:hypothetical protein
MIRITSQRDGFRRAGMAHSAKPATYPDDYFTGEQLAQLQGEPMLTVECLSEPELAAPEEKAPRKRKAG